MPWWCSYSCWVDECQQMWAASLPWHGIFNNKVLLRKVAESYDDISTEAQSWVQWPHFGRQKPRSLDTTRYNIPLTVLVSWAGDAQCQPRHFLYCARSWLWQRDIRTFWNYCRKTNVWNRDCWCTSPKSTQDSADWQRNKMVENKEQWCRHRNQSRNSKQRNRCWNQCQTPSDDQRAKTKTL